MMMEKSGRNGGGTYAVECPTASTGGNQVGTRSWAGRNPTRAEVRKRVGVPEASMKTTLSYAI